MDEPKLENPKAGTSKRDRSPNYPSLTFTEAMDAARKLWTKEKKHLMSVDLASQHLGYRKANGASLPMLGAMKKYGLLVANGKEVRVSDDANTIFVYPGGAPEAVVVIKRLAMLPTLFGDVLAKFPDGLPSDANLRAKLQDEWAFASPKAADNFIRALREAVSLTGNSWVAGTDPVVDNNGFKITEEPSMTQTQENAIKPTSGAAMQTKPLTPPPSLQLQGEEEYFRARLAGGRMVRVLFQGTPPTQSEIQKLITLLECTKDQYPVEEKATTEA